MWWISWRLCFWHKPTELTHSFLLCPCVCFCDYGPFNCTSFHKFSRQLSAFSLCSPGLISALLVLSTKYLFMKVSFSPDIILCGWLGSKQQLTNLSSNHNSVKYFTNKQTQPNTLHISQATPISLGKSKLSPKFRSAKPKEQLHTFWSLFIFRGYSARDPASIVCNDEQDDLFKQRTYTETCISHSQHRKNSGEVLEKNTGEWNSCWRNFFHATRRINTEISNLKQSWLTAFWKFSKLKFQFGSFPSASSFTQRASTSSVWRTWKLLT